MLFHKTVNTCLWVVTRKILDNFIANNWFIKWLINTPMWIQFNFNYLFRSLSYTWYFLHWKWTNTQYDNTGKILSKKLLVKCWWNWLLDNAFPWYWFPNLFKSRTIKREIIYNSHYKPNNSTKRPKNSKSEWNFCKCIWSEKMTTSWKKTRKEKCIFEREYNNIQDLFRKTFLAQLNFMGQWEN